MSGYDPYQPREADPEYEYSPIRKPRIPPHPGRTPAAGLEGGVEEIVAQNPGY